MKNKTDNYNDLLDKKRNENKIHCTDPIRMSSDCIFLLEWTFLPNVCTPGISVESYAERKKMSLFLNVYERFSQIQYVIKSQLPEE